MENEIKLGFSTGSLHKFCTTKEALGFIKKAGCKFVELGFVKLKSLEEGLLDEIQAVDLDDFEYVSFHAPKFDYGKDKNSLKILDKIKYFSNNVRNIDLVIFHPDTIKDFSVLRSVGAPVAVENMDNHKQSCRSTEDFEQILDGYSDFTLVLDVNHIYSNDLTMKMGSDFYKKFGNKISQVHVSGYAGYHDPLFNTKQLDIVRGIQNFNIPIIVESVIALEDLKKEKSFILECIDKIQRERLVK